MKPSVITPNYDGIPEELRAQLIWLLWELRLVKGRWTKIPLIADGSRRFAATNRPETWRPYDEAVARAPEADGGIGMCFTGPYCGVDLDCCRNRETGEIAPWAQRIVDLVNSYTEVSPSGEGLHIVLGLTQPLPDGVRMRGGKEKAHWEIAVYDRTSPRYFCVTGVVVDGHDQIRVCDPAEFYPSFERGELDPPAARARGKANGKGDHAGAQVGGNPFDKRERLLRGEWEGLYGSRSEADFALCWILAAELNDDPQKIDQAFRKSGMFRPKWDERRGVSTYGAITITKVIRKRKEAQAKPADSKLRPILLEAIALLRSSDWDAVLGYNEFSLHVECRKDPPFQRLDAKNWTDNDSSLACVWFQERGLTVNTRLAAEAVQVIARENRFHPVRDYLSSVRWDGQPRICEWVSRYLGAESTEWTRAIGERWLISAVARILEPGCQADHALLIQGPQGKLKSTALRTLAGDEWFTDHISDLGSKDSRIELHGKWVLELAELDKVRRGEMERVKAFLTARVDNFRLPYGRISEAVPRSCVFAATVNDETPLTDETGGRRFWPVCCGTIDNDALARDRDQLWAEAYERYYDGAAWWLDSAELNAVAAEEQDKRYEPGIWDDVIREWITEPRQRYETENPHLPIRPFDSEPGRVTVTDILIHGVGKPLDRLIQSDRLQVVRCLVHDGWKRWQSGEKTHRGKWFYVRTP